MLHLVKNEPDYYPDVPRCVLNADKHVIPWVERRLDLPAGYFRPGTMSIGVMCGGKAIAGVLIANYIEHPGTGAATAEIHIAATDKRWCTRKVLNFIFRYVFVHLKLTRLTSICRKRNKEARRINDGVGFKLEGIARRAWDGQQDAACYSMLPHECRWLEDK